MKIPHRIYAAVFCLAGMAVVTSVAAQVIATSRFTIHHEGVNGLYARLVAERADAGYELVSGLLDHHTDHTIDIVITPTDARFRELTAGRLPDWSEAAAIGADTIILSPLEGHKQDLVHVLTHEIAHVIINDAAGGQPVPRWFHEGVAETVSGSLGIRGRIHLIVRSARDDLLSFADIQDIFSSEQQDATLAYDQSMLAVRQLAERYGGHAAGDILARMEQGEPFESAFTATTGMTVIVFEKAYLAVIRKRFGYGSLLPGFLNTWMLILGLAAMVFVIQRIRARRIMRRWEEEGPDSTIPPAPDDFDFPD